MNVLSKARTAVEFAVIGGTLVFAIHGLAVMVKETAEEIGDAIDRRAERLAKNDSETPTV